MMCAAAVILSEEKAIALGLKPLAYIKGYADAAQEPKCLLQVQQKQCLKH
jgi:acetyl-CoA acetyltransferase